MVTRITKTVDTECLSALVDGEIDTAELIGACEAWRLDEATRATWHAYQLIGDVLRSDDLASDAAYDCSFLLGVRSRLASEPVVLAPSARAGEADASRAVDAAAFADESLSRVAPPRPARAPRSAWMVPAAMTAGFALVVGAFTVLRGDSSAPDPGSTLARIDRSAATRIAAVNFDAPTAVATANGTLLRNAQLDRYLEAHKQFSGSSVLGTPSAFLRSATLDTSAR